MSDLEAQRQALELQVKALKDLIEVARAVVSTLDLDTVLQAILTSAMKFAETPAGSIALYDEEKGELALHAHSGLTVDFIRTERWSITPGGLTGRVLSRRDVLYVEDTALTEFQINPVMVKEGIRSLICIPLVLQERILGILYLDDFAPRVFDREKMNLLSVLASFASMSIDNAKLHNRTKLMAITDSLTGLYNYRYFHQMLDHEIARAERYLKPLSVIMMDVDDFKKFNDRHGHPCGDRVLASVAALVAGTLRNVDSAYRYGGEEFMILLPETGREGALLVAERLRAVIAGEATAGLSGVAEAVTVSAGVVCYPADGDNAFQLMERVDQLMYAAKARGKNSVHTAAPC